MKLKTADIKELSGAASLALGAFAGGAAFVTIRSALWLWADGERLTAVAAFALGAPLGLFGLAGVMGALGATTGELRRARHARKWDVRR